MPASADTRKDLSGGAARALMALQWPYACRTLHVSDAASQVPQLHSTAHHTHTPLQEGLLAAALAVDDGCVGSSIRDHAAAVLVRRRQVDDVARRQAVDPLQALLVVQGV